MIQDHPKGTSRPGGDPQHPRAIRSKHPTRGLNSASSPVTASPASFGILEAARGRVQDVVVQLHGPAQQTGRVPLDLTAMSRAVVKTMTTA